MQKRGQVGLFFVIGFIILAALATLIYFQGETISNYFRSEVLGQQVIPKQVEPIHLHMQQCLEETTKDAILYNSGFGGLYNPIYVNDYGNTPYYFIEGEAFIPTLKELEFELEKYIDLNFEECIDISNFTQRFDIFSEFPVSKVKIFQENVIVNLIYPLEIKSQEKTFKLKRFNTKIKARYGIVYNITKTIIQEQIEYPKEMCISCIAEQVDEYEGVRGEFNNFAPGEAEYTIIDFGQPIDEEEINFIVALRFEV